MLHIDIVGSNHAYKECLEMWETKHDQSPSDANTSEYGDSGRCKDVSADNSFW